MQTDNPFNHLSEVILGYKKDFPILVGINGVERLEKPLWQII